MPFSIVGNAKLNVKCGQTWTWASWIWISSDGYLQIFQLFYSFLLITPMLCKLVGTCPDLNLLSLKDLVAASNLSGHRLFGHR